MEVHRRQVTKYLRPAVQPSDEQAATKRDMEQTRPGQARQDWYGMPVPHTCTPVDGNLAQTLLKGYGLEEHLDKHGHPSGTRARPPAPKDHPWPAGSPL